jgi:hypothetical protein
MEKWIACIRSNVESEQDKMIAVIYLELLKWVVSTEYRGGCHDTSAMFHILLNEAGIKNTLCIGEVKSGKMYFDHSWVEINNKIYDAAVCMPLEGGSWHPPVFKLIDLDTHQVTELGYGVHSPVGFDEHTRWISQVNIGVYALANPDMPGKLWLQVVFLAEQLGFELDANLINSKYKNSKRKLCSNSL